MVRLKNRLAEIMAIRARQGRRISQLELAEATGIAQSTISAYYTNKVTRFDADTVVRLLTYLDISIEEFFILDPEDPSNGENSDPALVGVATVFS
jgi:transcriptional regulator with XRE-family HTH domain